MENRGDPVRWLDPDSDVPSELRDVLNSARGDGGGADALSSLAGRLPLAGAAKLPVGAAAGAAKKAILSWKLAAWVAGAAAVGGAATNLVALVPATRPAITAPAQVGSAAPRGLAPEVVSPDLAREVASPDLARPGSGDEHESPARGGDGAARVESGNSKSASLAGDGHPASAPPTSRSQADGAQTANHPLPVAPAPFGSPSAVIASSVPSETAAAPSAGSPDSLGAEAKLLLQAREEMARDPRKALRATEAHDSTFAGGALAEERDVLRVEALVRLGKHEEAARVAASFRARHPQSSHLARIDRLLRAPR